MPPSEKDRTLTHDLPHTWFSGGFFQVPVIAVLRGLSPHEAVRRANRAWDAGVEHVEVTIETPEAVAALTAVVSAASERGLTVGAGTITTTAQLEAAAAANASFTVSPGLNEEIVAESVRRSLPHLPGVATASEILRAKALGLTWLKAFPASVLGHEWTAAMKGPFPDVNFVATGGMQAATARAYLDSGVSVVGLSSDFATDQGASAVQRFLASNAAPPAAAASTHNLLTQLPL
ncbi:bifunctional 4-hydroxy-2-oxoglutarate aldolase/2-dehydro-3-deoxy-phosphogluconate aldolase [Paenarthrobacter ureafaciens]|uniref:bifunctional 4-hydroxy-2-oxoglutarate aldolase/2-dehydro-3-deoxy-phosphogluconate aldolase n=1 Tax=Paenarthrobacter ureafaciens TaxID=37931 RepID=UPI002264F57F|nr:bifunctional 4-hydroxy-2-oxoglutarate aldolase/2-dehydro-3-deoxy-phosphogluconate aldolase [Paenarthrobacter ureafaciens]MCX8453482.1 bifunctional 4-hydroxy-2-oxoglutarate aldolase/2-dehydro-3-deoxy-phosphogluconate aldolase [Paenarthrobacter ureafaciens]MCY0973141.1 bifunctional 4-hydroxy-2-oxoglutarate aldolase/2-dehydro-3-deoxy-phosphogluconate aldolase [Paenarthrobacter ureafaciens]